jgi:DNA-binding Lrp family transcriptional regulator
MDKTDMSLIMLLTANSRLPYTELAEKLNLSVNAVHKRIQTLIETGIIRKFTAKLSLQSVGAIVVFVSGISQLSSFQDLSNKLRAHDAVYWLAEGGGKFLYIGAYIRSLNELTELIRFVEKEAQITKPTVRIAHSEPTAEHRVVASALFQDTLQFPPANTTFSALDYKIIRSLKDNSRKLVSDVAMEVGASTKTVRRRLMRMVKSNLIELGIEWYPDKSNDIITLVDLQLKDDADINLLPNEILQKYSPAALFYWRFVNSPNVITFVIWTNRMNELQDLCEKLEKEPRVYSMEPNILYTGYIFDTWRDHMLEKL